MQFKSSFNFGHKVSRASELASTRSNDFALLEIMEICFNIDGEVLYLCENLKTGLRQHYAETALVSSGNAEGYAGHYVFESGMGLREIVIRESHKNGEMVQERMMEVVAVIFVSSDEAHYVCEDTYHGNRQLYTGSMLVGDPDFNQDEGKYPISPEETEHTNSIPVEG